MSVGVNLIIFSFDVAIRHTMAVLPSPLTISTDRALCTAPPPGAVSALDEELIQRTIEDSLIAKEDAILEKRVAAVFQLSDIFPLINSGAKVVVQVRMCRMTTCCKRTTCVGAVVVIWRLSIS